MIARIFAVALGVSLVAGAAAAQDARVERWLAAAERALERGRTGQARRLWRRAAQSAPEDGRAAIRFARTLPDDPARVASAEEAVQERAREALRLLDAHLEAAAEPALEARRARAWARAVLGDHAGAIEASAALTGGDTLLRRLATLAVLREDLAAAERALEAAHRAVPEDHDVLSELGAVELARGAPEAAIERFARIVARDPSDLDARRDLAGALVAAGRAGEAVSLLRRAVDAHPDTSALHLELARAALEAGQSRTAERAARAAIDALPADDPRGHATLGEALAACGRPTEARRAFEQALRRAPDDLRARVGLDALDAPAPGLGRRLTAP